MTICERCLHNRVCGAEGCYDEALKFCDDFIGWISVSEKLPEEGCCILTTINGIRGIKVRSGFYSDNIFNNDNGNIWKPTDKEILAWMPLPEPYKTESEDKE